MTYRPQLPLQLETYRQQFEATTRPFVKIIPMEACETALAKSKIGGTPYLPKSAAYPTNSAGGPLFFLAQLNFAEMPRLESFPENGILQFFISAGGLYGMDMKNPFNQAGFRVVYFENEEEGNHQLNEITASVPSGESLPITAGASYPLQFELHHEIVPLSDHQFTKMMGEDFFGPFGERQWDLMDSYAKMNNAGGHKLGGYAFFIQQDPRYRMGDLELLFQLDTDKAIQCMWGDMGVGHFFIKKEDLQNLDFSKAMFYWDCY